MPPELHEIAFVVLIAGLLAISLVAIWPRRKPKGELMWAITSANRFVGYVNQFERQSWEDMRAIHGERDVHVDLFIASRKRQGYRAVRVRVEVVDD